MQKAKLTRLIGISLLALVLALPLASAVSTGYGAAQVGGVAIIGTCTGIAITAGLAGGAGGSFFTWCSLIALLTYFIIPIIILIVILLMEFLLRFDSALAGIGYGINQAANALIHKKIGVSILPTSSSSLDHDTKEQLLKVNLGLNIFLNINRAILYAAFFLSLAVIFPFNTVLNFSPLLYTIIFNAFNTIITVIEPLFLVTLVIILGPLNLIIDVMLEMVGLARD